MSFLEVPNHIINAVTVQGGIQSFACSVDPDTFCGC
jgi:hypothetical protein